MTEAELILSRIARNAKLHYERHGAFPIEVALDVSIEQPRYQYRYASPDGKTFRATALDARRTVTYVVEGTITDGKPTTRHTNE